MEHQAKGLDRPKTTQVGTWLQTISSEGKKAAYVSLLCSLNQHAFIRLITWFLCAVEDAQFNTEE